MEEYDYENDITCPYCGYKDRDSWEVMSGEEDLGVIECGHCCKEFEAFRNVSITYTTKKIDNEYNKSLEK
jgi:transcription elongation factor Elf1